MYSMMLHLVCLLWVWVALAKSDETSTSSATVAGVNGADKSKLENPAVEKTLTFEVEHAFGESESFTKRADIGIRVVGDTPKVISRGEHQIPSEMIEGFKELLGRNGLYKIRMRADPSNSSSPYVQASIPSCKLQNSAWKEDIVLHFASGDIFPSTTLVGLGYASPISAGIARTCDPKKIASNLPFKTKISVAEKSVAQSIPLQAKGPRPVHLSKSDLGAAAVDSDKPGGSQRQSFLMQYWYIILPIAVIALIGGGEEPKKKGEGTSSSGSGASAPST